MNPPHHSEGAQASLSRPSLYVLSGVTWERRPEATASAPAASEPQGMRRDCAFSLRPGGQETAPARGPAPRRPVFPAAPSGVPGPQPASPGRGSHPPAAALRGAGRVRLGRRSRLCAAAAAAPRLPPPGPPPGRSTWLLHVALPAAAAALARAESGVPAPWPGSPPRPAWPADPGPRRPAPGERERVRECVRA